MESNIISKEQIAMYRIEPAANDRSDHWREQLSYAVRLGNEFKGKTTISFQTYEGIKTVVTTVWSLTDKYIHLKGGVTIPLNSIIDIHF